MPLWYEVVLLIGIIGGKFISANDYVGTAPKQGRSGSDIRDTLHRILYNDDNDNDGIVQGPPEEPSRSHTGETVFELSFAFFITVITLGCLLGCILCAVPRFPALQDFVNALSYSAAPEDEGRETATVDDSTTAVTSRHGLIASQQQSKDFELSAHPMSTYPQPPSRHTSSGIHRQEQRARGGGVRGPPPPAHHPSPPLPYGRRHVMPTVPQSPDYNDVYGDEAEVAYGEGEGDSGYYDDNAEGGEHDDSYYEDYYGIPSHHTQLQQPQAYAPPSQQRSDPPTQRPHPSPNRQHPTHPHQRQLPPPASSSVPRRTHSRGPHTAASQQGVRNPHPISPASAVSENRPLATLGFSSGNPKALPTPGSQAAQLYPTVGLKIKRKK